MATKGVIVAAGYGSRMLPVTRCVPKEMLPLGSRPAIDWVVQEFIDAGITELLVITSRRKRVLEDWFDRDPELEAVFAAEGADEKLARIQPPRINAHFARQQNMLGSGHALLLAREFAGDDPVVVAYPDDLFGPPNISRALIDTWRETGCSVLSALTIEDEEELSRYGVLQVREADQGVLRVETLIEKPPLGTAPSNLVSMGRYLFTPEVFDALQRGWEVHRGGEYFHVGALTELASAGRLVATPVTSTRYDVGTIEAWLRTSVDLALEDPQRGPALRAWLDDRLR